MTIRQDLQQQQVLPSENYYPDLQSVNAKYTDLLVARHPDKIFELVAGIGSPLHCVFPQQFLENIQQLREVLSKHHLNAKIYYAKKANKAQSFARMCKEAGIGIDVASRQEFELALAAGINGEDISVSGPEKNTELLKLAIHQGSQIAVNSIEELQRIISLTKSQASSLGANSLGSNSSSATDSKASSDLTRSRNGFASPKVLLRYQPDTEKNSRFGITKAQLPVALNLLKNSMDTLALVGFSFHLAGYDGQARVATASELVQWIINARNMGFVSCNQINIGGGLPVKYSSGEQWQDFQNSLELGHFHRNQSFAQGFYPYGKILTAPAALDLILSRKVQPNKTLAQQLRELDIQFAIEPGRALLDQAGISVFSVQGMKHIDIENPYWIATVSGMSFSLSEQWFGSEFLPSPTLLKKNFFSAQNPLPTLKIFPTAIAGSSCLECDMVSWRKIPFASKPAVNDCVVYLNTAGYQMDSNESEFHSIPITPKVCIWFDDNQIKWQLD